MYCSTYIIMNIATVAVCLAGGSWLVARLGWWQYLGWPVGEVMLAEHNPFLHRLIFENRENACGTWLHVLLKACSPAWNMVEHP